MLKMGQVAPAFLLEDESKKKVSLSDFKGKKVIVYFYPKDDTPGCTKEAIGFTAALDQIQADNAVVLGISKDTSDSHTNFMNKYHLKIKLLADVDGKVCEAYDVWREKTNYGKTYMGIVRSTFLINEQGVIEKIWNNVKVDGHVDAVCDYVKRK